MKLIFPSRSENICSKQKITFSINVKQTRRKSSQKPQGIQANLICGSAPFTSSFVYTILNSLTEELLQNFYSLT